MPNPLARVQNTSKQPPERPEAIPPVPEHPAGKNQPYLGIDDHGVPPTDEPSPTQANWDTREGRTYMPEEDEHEPIPVRIVQQHGNEFRKMRVHKMSINSAKTQQLMGRNMARQSVYLSNPDAAASIYVGTTVSMNIALNGFEVKPGQNVTLYTHDEVYVLGTVVDPLVQTAQAIEYYAVEE